MKKFTKVCLIIVGALFGVGMLLCGVSSVMGAGFGTIRQMAKNGELNRGNWHITEYGIYYSDEDDFDNDWEWSGDWDWDDEEIEAPEAPEAPEIEKTEVSEKSDNSENEMETGYAVADIKKMDLDIGAAALIFKNGTDSEKVKVTLKNGKSRYYEVGMSGDTLEIEYDVDNHLHHNNKAEIIVEMPAGMELNEMDLDIGAADVEINLDDVTCKKMKLDVGAANLIANEFHVTEMFDVSVGAGNVEIEGGTYEDVKIDCGVGNFELAGTVAGDMDADCGLGNMSLVLTGEKEDYNYKLTCGMGSIEIDGHTYSSISGSHKETNPGATAMINLDCGMGGIEVEFE